MTLSEALPLTMCSMLRKQSDFRALSLKHAAACGPRERFVRLAMVFGNFQIINIYVISLFTGVWKCSASEWTSSFQTNKETARNDLPITGDTFRRKYDAKAVSSKVQVPPLLRQHHNAAS